MKDTLFHLIDVLMIRLDAQHLDELTALVAKHYFAPRVEETVIPAVTEQKKIKITTKEPYTHEEQGGLNEWYYVAHVVALLLSIALGAVEIAAGIVTYIAVVAILIVDHERFRETVKERRTREVDRFVQRKVEVEPERIERSEVRSTTRILAVGRGVIPFSAVATPRGQLVSGPEALCKSQEMAFPSIKHLDALRAEDQRLRAVLDEVPWVLDGEQSMFEVDGSEYAEGVPLRGLEREIRSYFEATEARFGARTAEQVTVRGVADAGLLTLMQPGGGKAASVAAQLEAQSIVRRLEQEQGENLEGFARNWVDYWDLVSATLFMARRTSLCDQVAPECFDLGHQLSYSAFNFYCPTCNREQQQMLLSRDYSVQQEDVAQPVSFSKNTRCVYDPTRDSWRCPACAETHDRPIPIHKVLDEILMPTYDRLMEEHKVERLKIHAGARDKERDLLREAEAEVERLRYDETSKIIALSEELERFRADIRGEHAAIDSMVEVLEAYQFQQDRVMRSISSFSQRIAEEISERTQRVLDEVDRVKVREMQALSQELDKLSRAKRLEDERRDAIQRSILESNQRQEHLIKENTEVTREGLQAVKGAVDRNTEVTREGLESVKGAVDRNTEVTREGLKSVKGAVDRNTAVTRNGLEKVAGKIDKGNAIQAAIAEEQGVDIHDEPIWRLDRKVKHLGNRAAGALTGRATWETQQRQLD